MRNLFFLICCVFLLGASSCSTLADIETLCIMEPESEMCWVNKEQNRGYPIEEMDAWFAMDERDFRQILKKLRNCDGATR